MEKDIRLYYKYSDYLKNKYGEKVYKLPINLDLTCPNRDGCVGTNGCIFCSEIGTGFESLSNTLNVKDQIKKNMAYIEKKYNANKFIAYFQNFTNTYLPVDDFEKAVIDSIDDNIVEVAISTRPDCINNKYLEVLDNIKSKYRVNITIELGLQSVNYSTLDKINRGHSLAEFIDAVLRIKKYDFDICTHMILNLPYDTIRDVIEGAKILSVLGINQVKLHSLYIARNTRLAELYANNRIDVFTKEDYVNKVVKFLEYTDSNIAVQRLVSRAPKEETIFCNWNTSWWKIKDDIENKMIQDETYQGRLCTYKNGSALTKKFNL
ncbi:TIGR01212 family radical SAM protein [Vallitalea longa]|uniref:TIGR01212 family radical SAM protein n=1 Tax=Vallitalea longa TaxID=2936439 RepID=A0A9W5YCN8_9FIRM|nr:TIGR01212 family radical SAM protein [Vallitalea longa]GKX28798.1 TIGR01212 family radical SAM protein [Vallitalea longa]